MLSFLIHECGAAAADLPQLVRLKSLLDAEESGTALSPQTRTPPPAPAPRDSTCLGFLLQRCASTDEVAQCAMLQMLHGLLTDEAHDVRVGGPATAHDSSLPPVPPVPPPPRSTAQHREHAAGTALPDSALPPPLCIPVPIVPGAGDWKGTVALLPSPTVSTQVPPTPCAAAEAVAEVRTSSDAASPKNRPAAVTDTPAGDDGGPVVPSLSERPPARPTHGTPGVAVAAAAAGAAAASPLPPRHPLYVPAYAGRMPRAAADVFATRSSATVRLLAGGAVRPSSAGPRAPRPMSVFAKRFIADMYERVSTPHAGAMSSPIPTQQSSHQPPPPPPAAPSASSLLLATGSGVYAARGRRASSGLARVALHGNTVAARSLPFTPAPPPGRVGGACSQARPVHPVSPRTAAAAETAPATPSAPPARPHSSLPRRDTSAAAADGGALVVVGARIRLPSLPTTRHLPARTVQRPS
ncbi:hypothetical protein NESM_000480900 [Novymonas esmeraldas]|uniref:Uncharacterized protein n=1 Tax=Novymonas esmeraldas TaxID=1808958 RepID=A0AAW0EQ70_9TRYP